MPRRPARLLLLILPLALALPAAEEDRPTAAVAPAPAAGQATQDLLQRLGDAPLLAADGEEVRWSHPDGTASFVVADATVDGDALVATGAGTIRIDRSLLAAGDGEAIAILARLVEHAIAAGLEPATAEEPFLFQESILTGLRLRRVDELVIEAGVLRRVPVESDRQADIEAVQQAVERLIGSLDRSGLDRLSQRAVTALLERVDDRDTLDDPMDEASPSFARRVIRHGWLERVLAGVPAARRLAEAVDAAERFRPDLSFTGEGGLRLDHVVDAFGKDAWILRTDELVRLATAPPMPMYHWPTLNPDNHGPTLREAMVVVDLPPGADPLAAPEEALPRAHAVRLHHGDEVLCAWSAAGGFTADEAAWREVVPAVGDPADPNVNLDDQIVSGYMPPHIVLVDPAGDIHRIFTAHGPLTPPRDATREEAERFLREAAEVLPDAAHLDLIGQYLVKYVYDSPDSRRPLLIGTGAVNGDIHQTAFETLATATGGVCRGDCDDLSELYQNILDLQGRTAHVISLPGHAAVAWAEEHDDGWHVFVMQTGPTLEFVDPVLQEALAQAYKRFDASDMFDPNGLGLLLRFSGENTRSAWRLSYRIFSEPDYAETMIDVQRDWHFQTYLQGIKKMERLIAEGDEDTANFRELAGLFSFTGQHAKAAEYLRLAIERTPEPESRLFLSSELAHHLLEAGEHDEAQLVVEEILTVQLPPLREALGDATVQVGLQLAGFLQSDAPDLAVVVLDEVSMDAIGRWTKTLDAWIANDFDQAIWDNSQQVRQWRRLLSWFAGSAIGAMDELGPDAFATDPKLRELGRTVQTWLDGIAFRDVEDDSDVLRRYAIAGSFYAAVLGDEQLVERIAASRLPERASIDHTDRVGGVAQVALDLPWIRASVPFWTGRLQQLVRDHEAAIDPARAERLGVLLEEAIAASDEFDLSSAYMNKEGHVGRVIVALLTEDEAALRALMRHVAEKDDKRLRDDTAEWIGNTAPHLSPEWWNRVLQVWVDETDYKPKYYWIAWRAALSEAPRHALRAAELAAERFADDPAFVEEHRFMRELLAEEAARADAPAEEPATAAP